MAVTWRAYCPRERVACVLELEDVRGCRRAAGERCRLLSPVSEEAAARLRELALIELFRGGELSGGKAAELLGLSRAAWLDLLARRGVPHAVVTEQNLTHDLKTLADHRKRLVTSSPTPGR